VAGAALGVLFLAYFGWFLWSAPGFVVALLIAVPWRERRALPRVAVLLAVAVGVFFAITHQILIAVLTKGSQETDQYFYFDTDVRPTYFEHWFDDRPPPGLGPWPVPGGLGGVDVFAVLLFLGLGLALVLGSRRIEVLLIATLIGGAWLLRFLLASRMYVTQSVQLYPRTSVELLYGFLLATGLAMMLIVRHATTLTTRFAALLGTASAVALRFRAGAAAGLLTGSLLLLASMADTVGDVYMPRDDSGNGQLAYRAYTSIELDGTCPQFMEPNGVLCRYVPPTSTPNGTPIVLPQQ
jgi:galactan 5-O-arabinofuranosyltransferase